MELLIEILGEIFFEGIFELSQNKKVPKSIRFIILFIIGLIYGAILCFLVILSIKAVRSNDIIVAIFFGLCSVLLILLLIAFSKKIKQKNTTN